MDERYILLSDTCVYSNDRIEVSKLNLGNYISTENMLPDKGGIVDAANLPPTKKVTRFLPNEILLSNIRPYFRKIWFADKEGGCSNDVLVLRVKKGYNPKFIYYVLSDNNFFNYDTVTSKGTKMPRGSDKAIMKYLVPNLIKSEQDKIADILYSYDRLIVNNNKRIELLKHTAESLFKEWFVRFRFPEYEKYEFYETNLGKIPNCFSVVPIGELLDYYIGGGWGEDNCSEQFPIDGYVIRGTDFEKVNNGCWNDFPYRYHKKSNYNSRQLKPYDIILEVSGGTAEQPVGRTVLVTPDLLQYVDNKIICASFCKLIRCNNNVSPIYLKYWLQYMYDTRMIDKFQLQSTGIINFKFEYFLRKGLILLPEKNIMNMFVEKILPILQEIDNLGQQNMNLNKQRDLLLPRLMSGKLEVK